MDSRSLTQKNSARTFGLKAHLLSPRTPGAMPPASPVPARRHSLAQGLASCGHRQSRSVLGDSSHELSFQPCSSQMSLLIKTGLLNVAVCVCMCVAEF